MQGIKFLRQFTQHYIRNITFTKYSNNLHALSRSLHIESYYKANDSDIVYSYNKALDSHIKTGSLSLARQQFDEMSVRDVVSWNLILSGYKRYGKVNHALEFYAQMVSHGVRESPSTFSTVLSVCSNNGFYFEGLQVHCRVVVGGLSENLYIGGAIVDLYMKMGDFDVGLRVLDGLPERNFAVWNSVLRRFCEVGLWSEVVGLYSRIRCDGVEMNELTVCYLMQGCYHGEFVSEGKQLHCHVIKSGFGEANVFVANALVDFYSSCGTLYDARKSFEVIPYENVISWNSIVSAHACNGQLFDAVGYFTIMQLWNMKPSVRSFVSLLNSCSESRNLFLGRQLHCCVMKLGFDFESVHVQSALIDMYGKCYEIGCSVDVYERCPQNSRECCNALLTSMLYCGLVEEVVEFFKFMVDDGIDLDEVSLSTSLKAIAGSSFAGLSSCRLLHAYAIKSGLESHVAVSASLIDYYSKVGQVEHSQQVFESLSSPNVVCFTSIINGCAWNGLGRECLKFLDMMIQKGLKPDRVTFLCTLTGCSHSGLVQEGQRIFDSMKILHGIDPDQKHYSCMVDLLGRAGMVYEAEELLKKSPAKDDPVMWSSLLRSCRMHKNKTVGRTVAEHLLELEPRDPGVCLQASGFYLEIGDSELSNHYREIAMASKVMREVGCSFVDINK